jgi:hypothetical protein
VRRVWICRECGWRNDLDDGPVCENCDTDNSLPEPEPSGEAAGPGGGPSPATADASDTADAFLSTD